MLATSPPTSPFENTAPSCTVNLRTGNVSFYTALGRRTTPLPAVVGFTNPEEDSRGQVPVPGAHLAGAARGSEAQAGLRYPVWHGRAARSPPAPFDRLCDRRSDQRARRSAGR